MQAWSILYQWRCTSRFLKAFIYFVACITIFSLQWSADAEYLFCQKGSTISILSVNTSSVISSLGEVGANQQEDTINCFALGNDDTSLVTHHKSGLFKLWDWKSNSLNLNLIFVLDQDWVYYILNTLTFILFFLSFTANKLTKLWKSLHKGPVTQIIFSNDNALMASGGSDSAVRLWNLQHHTCTHHFKGLQGVTR